MQPPLSAYAVAKAGSVGYRENLQPVHLNNIVEQDHRGVKRITRPILGFKSFEAAQDTLVGIELMHMIKKKQLRVGAGDEGLTAAELFYSLAA
jgi:transposase-like protein